MNTNDFVWDNNAKVLTIKDNNKVWDSNVVNAMWDSVNNGDAVEIRNENSSLRYIVGKDYGGIYVRQYINNRFDEEKHIGHDFKAMVSWIERWFEVKVKDPNKETEKKKYSVRLYLHTFVDVEVEAESEDEAKYIAVNNESGLNSEEIFENMILAEEDPDVAEVKK